ncbi:hypothetical protein XPA_010022 [Xanthoria parietina]
MYLYTTQVLAALAGFLALTTANPLNLDAAPAALDKRACPADCNNQYPLARKLGQPCGGDCDKTYRAGATTCSCNLGAIVLCKAGTWQLVADCGKTGQACFNNQPGNPTGGRTCEKK